MNDTSEQLEQLWRRVCTDVLARRGGVALLTDILDERTPDQFLIDAAREGSLWAASDDQGPHALALLRRGVLQLLYVTPESRRRGVARELVTALLAFDEPPRDGLALPGDRATKSLYESLGWKARLLTMRAE